MNHLQICFQNRLAPLHLGAALPAEGTAGGDLHGGSAAVAEGVWPLALTPAKVGRCRLTVSKPVLKAPVVSALEATI